jgi:hypothetical protein
MKTVKIILLKDIGADKKGAILEVSPERANYWVRVGVSKEYVEPKIKKKDKSKDK